MKLSILIPSLYNRQHFLAVLLSIIYRQEKEWLDQTEVIVSVDNGGKSIGQKRNELLQSANGEYLVFIDDDDEISLEYLRFIFEGIEKGVDHVGIAMMFQPDNSIHKLVKCSKDYAWCEKDGVYYRSVQHVCAVKSSIAKQVSFPLINFGEDKAYSDQLTKLVATEHLIEEPIYFYNYRSKK